MCTSLSPLDDEAYKVVVHERARFSLTAISFSGDRPDRLNFTRTHLRLGEIISAWGGSMANKRVASENGYEFLIVYNILGAT